MTVSKIMVISNQMFTDHYKNSTDVKPNKNVKTIKKAGMVSFFQGLWIIAFNFGFSESIGIWNSYLH